MSRQTIMIDISKVKNEIVEYLNSNGISLPIRISKAVSLEPICVAAILSEMVDAKTIRATNFRLGSSLFYYLDSQEQQIEQIGDKYLSGVEKEAYLLLKKNGILLDDEQTSAIRVALKKIKDFAIPQTKNDTLYWKYVFYEEKPNLINEEPKQIQEESELIEQKEEEEQQKLELMPEKQKEQSKEQEQPVESKKIESIFDTKKEISQENKIPFLEEIQNCLKNLGYDYFDLFEDSRNEIVGCIIADTSFGKKKFLVVARNKKSLSDNDLISAKKQADNYKMPLLFISNGKLSKKASDYVNEYSNLITFKFLN